MCVTTMNPKTKRDTDTENRKYGADAIPIIPGKDSSNMDLGYRRYMEMKTEALWRCVSTTTGCDQKLQEMNKTPLGRQQEDSFQYIDIESESLVLSKSDVHKVSTSTLAFSEEDDDRCVADGEDTMFEFDP